MMRYNPEVLHVNGKCQISADALPQLTLPIHLTYSSLVETFACSKVDQLPATAQRLQEIIEALGNDEVCMQVRGYCKAGLPAPSTPTQVIIGKQSSLSSR